MVVVDEPTESGGADLGPSTTRLAAVALASCTAITLEMYAGRKGWDLGDLEAAAECEREDVKVATLALDVTAKDSGERIVAAAVDAFGQLDILVNNAGTAQRRDLDDVADEDWYAALELNVMAPMRAMRAAVP